jgi:hypothetical protein
MGSNWSNSNSAVKHNIETEVSEQISILGARIELTSGGNKVDRPHFTHVYRKCHRLRTDKRLRPLIYLAAEVSDEGLSLQKQRKTHS